MSAEPEPYIGPRPFSKDDRKVFFGRDRESDDLFSLVLAHQVILVYAASGAGKSSLLNAGLIPRLQEEKFHVLGSGRVAGPLPKEAGLITNLYIFHALSRWNGEFGLGLTVQQLAGMTLLDFLEFLDRARPSEARALIFDQFEEFFTHQIEIQDKRRAFINQIAKSLNSGRRLRIVFAMREEYLVQFEPFVYQLPDRLRTRMRVEPLRPREAIDAIRKPVEALDLEFERGKDDPVKALVEELRRVQGEFRADIEREVGDFVDPLQLQVVCQNMWRQLPAEVKVYAAERQKLPLEVKREKKIISPADVKVGNVDHALSRHYDNAIATAVAISSTSEGELRRWFSDSLISETGIRRIALAEDEHTARLSVNALSELKEQGIIRRETRAGSSWYELSHDRFIQPVQVSNRAWFDRFVPAEALRLKLEKAAAIGGARLDEAELHEAEEFIKTPEALLLGTSEAVGSFIKASRAWVDEENRRKDRELRNAKRASRWALCATVLLVLVVCLAGYWWITFKDKESLLKDKNSLQNDNQTLRNANQTLGDTNKSVQASNETLVKDNKSLGKQKNSLTEEVEKAKKDLNDSVQFYQAQKAENDKLQQRADAIRKQIQESTIAVTRQIDEYQNLARLSLMDSRARSQPLLSSREGDVLLKALGSLQNVQQSMSEGEKAEDIFGIVPLGLKAEILVTVLQNQLASALDKCESALRLSLFPSTQRWEPTGDFLQLRGDILLQEAVLAINRINSEKGLFAGDTRSRKQQIQTLLDKAENSYDQAQQYFVLRPVAACQNKLHIANIYRWRAANSQNEAEIATYRAEAQSKSSDILQDLSKGVSSEADLQELLITKAAVFRLLGNLVYDSFRYDVQAAKMSDIEKAISLYRQAVGNGDALISQPRSEGTQKTFILGSQLFTMANLADCYHAKLEKLRATKNNAEIESAKSALKQALDKRIAIGKTLLGQDNRNQYFATLLAFGYYNRAMRALDDKIPGSSEAEAYKDLRFAFCLTLQDPQPEITGQLLTQMKKQNPHDETAGERVNEITKQFQLLNKEITGAVLTEFRQEAH